MSERLQKVMAAAGIGSRRTCEAFIRQGRVTVNGQQAEIGSKVDLKHDEVRFDHELIEGSEAPSYILLHKPVDVLSSLQSQGGHETVDAMVDVPERLFPVGRLDLDSEGLILLTNDGELAHRLTHPSFEHEKEYRVQLDRPLDSEAMAKWRAGLRVPGLGRTSPADVRRESGDPRWIRVVMHEGKKRQIRRTAEHLGFVVRRLIRVRMGPLTLGDLPPGSWRRLSEGEADTLRMQTGLPRRANQTGSREKP
jgi:23S rRNA pseudouridine2605 synthase